MREKTIEQKLVQAVKTKGGIAPKFVSPGFSGVPDRLILLPDGKCGFVEVKVPRSRIFHPAIGWKMRLRGSQGSWRKATAAAGVKDTAIAAAGIPGIRPG